MPGGAAFFGGASAGLCGPPAWSVKKAAAGFPGAAEAFSAKTMQV